MKFHAKTSSKNLGKLMRSGESVAAAQQNPHDQKEETSDTTAVDVNIADKREILIQEDLAQLDTDSFEEILKDVVNAKTDLLKNVPSGAGPALISIMGLIDDAKGRLAAEKDLNNTENTKAPVKFDEVIDFIDDGAEEIVTDKVSPTKIIKLGHINVTSPIRGNPVVDLDKVVNENKTDSDEENYLMKMEQDPMSRMEMGQSKSPVNSSPRAANGPFTIIMAQPQAVEMTIDDLDLEKVQKSQKNNTCDEKEQIDFLKERGLHEFSKYDNILGPVSKGEFASFASTLSPCVGTELGVINPITSANYSVFQTCTSNGRLLPAIPRKFFSQNETALGSRTRPTPQKAPVTIMLNSTAPSSLLSMPEAYQNQISPPPVPTAVLTSIKSPNGKPAMESASKKRKQKKYAKKAEKAALAAAAAAKTEGEATGDVVEGEGEKKDNDINSSIDDEEKENDIPEEDLSQEEIEARRLKNRKAREKKRARRVEDKKESEEEKAEQEREEQERAEQERQRELQLQQLQIQQQQQQNGNTGRGNNRRQQQNQPASLSSSNRTRYCTDSPMSPPESSEPTVVTDGTQEDVSPASPHPPPPPLPPRRKREVVAESSESSLARFMNAEQWGITEKMNFCNIFGLHPFSIFNIGSNSSPEESTVPRRFTPGGKNKKNDKNVNSEYTVTQNEDKETLERILRELGIDGLDDLENHGGRKKKTLLKNLETQKQQERQQQNNKKKQQQQQKAAPPKADDESTSEEANKKKQGKKMDEVAVAASITKRCSSGAGQQSEEDDDQSYVSAQENLGGSNSRLSTPPAEFVDARQSRDDVLDNVMLDPNNYRVDEDVEQLAKQLQQEEDEFITVGKNKKKNKKAPTPNDHVTASSTASSSSPPNRRNTQPDAKAPSTAASSVSNFGTSSPSAPQQQTAQHQRNANRPVVHPTTLGDFIDSTKKDTHKNAKHKKSVPGAGSTGGQHGKKHTSFEEPPASPAFVDAVETPISVNTTPSSFSYADAAKKTSGENTPAHEMSPIPPPAHIPSLATTGKKKAGSGSPPSQKASIPEVAEQVKPTPPPVDTAPAPTQVSFAAAVSGVQLPPSSAAAASAGISFGYEETPEEKKKRQQKKAKAASPPPPQPKQMPTRMNGVQLLNAISDPNGKNKEPKNAEDEDKPQPKPEMRSALGIEIIASWKEAWDEFMTVGPPPLIYSGPIQR